MTHQATIIRRYLECTGFVLLWMAAGYYLRLHPLVYQLVGIPLTAVFQLAVARRPLVQLWVRDGTAFRIDWWLGAMAAGLFAACAALMSLGRGRIGLAPNAHWFLVVVAVAVWPAAFALREQRGARLRRALGVVAVAMAFRVAWHVAWAPTHGGVSTFPLSKLPDFFTDWIDQSVALFLVDEVVFRGALDPHLGAASDSRVHAWSSAVFVGILWSLWHLPATRAHARSFFQLFTQIGPDAFAGIIWGTMLSFCARRSGTLLPSAAIHAAGNAYALTLIR